VNITPRPLCPLRKSDLLREYEEKKTLPAHSQVTVPTELFRHSYIDVTKTVGNEYDNGAASHGRNATTFVETDQPKLRALGSKVT